MTTWSRGQSQEAGLSRAIGGGSKVTSSHHLARDAKVLAANKRENARITRWAEEAIDYKKVRKYNDTIGVKLSRKAKRALGGCVLRKSTRVELERRKAANLEFRANLAAFVRG